MSERSQREAREQRLRAALRENLKRRKAQARGREPAEEPGQQVAKPVTQGKPAAEDES